MKVKRPLLLVVMDGVGVRTSSAGNAVSMAYTPTIDLLAEKYLRLELGAHGTYVGLPSDGDMGNSEVGHNALGAGQVYDQGAKLVEQSIQSGTLFKGSVWRSMLERALSGATLHFIGLLSDGNVHSHQEHLFAMLRQATADGAKRLRVHVLLDGRDVPEKSAETYAEALEAVLEKLRQSGCDAQVASGGGRMEVTMDRYEADWSIVERGWQAHVLGQAEHRFASLSAAVAYFRENTELSDQYLPAFVITSGSEPVGPVCDGDGVIFFNFRGDRAIEISQAFEQANFQAFDRQRFPKILFAGMTQYDGDAACPKSFLVSPPAIANSLGEHLASQGIRQFACSETQKYGHVTYFWNGNRSGYFDNKSEEYLEIPSDTLPFDQKPWMKAWDITEATIERIREHRFDFARINYANGDMVGHTGNLEAAVIAVATVDCMLHKLLEACRKAGTILIVTADHGNCEQMFDAPENSLDQDRHHRHPWLNPRPRPKTSHTLAKVPFFIYDPVHTGWQANESIKNPGLANVANTALKLMGLEERPCYEPGLIL